MQGGAPMQKVLGAAVVLLSLVSCSDKKQEQPAQVSAAPAVAKGPTDVPRDPNNIVSIAIASPDHKTLVAALQAADYVAAIANPGPLTVFAPTDAAFAKLPAGTVEELVKPAKQADLKEILKYHATTSVYEAKDLKDGMVLGMANGQKATVKVAADGAITVNDARVLASVRASNGAVHVIDGVLLPPPR